MAGYTPVFSSMYDGSLCGRWPEAAVWASLLPLIDARGEICMTYEAISSRTGWPMELLRQGIAALMMPDPDSKSPDEDGRRLVLLDPRRNWGWRAVNHGVYRERARKQLRDQWRVATGENKERMQRRETVSTQSLTRDDPPEPVTTRPHPLSDTNTNTNTIKSIGTADMPKRKPTRAAAPLEPEQLGPFRLAYPARSGSQPWRRAISCIRARLKEGHSWEEMTEGAQRYRAYCEATGKVGTDYVMQAATFVGPEKHFLQPWNLPVAPTPQQTAEQTSLQRLADRRAAIGLANFRPPNPGETSTQYARAQDDEWNRKQLAQSLRASPPLQTSVERAQRMATALSTAATALPNVTNQPVGRRRNQT